MKKFNLKSITAIVAVAVASVGFVLAGFGTNDTKIEVGSGDIPLFWHEVLPDGTLGPVENQNPSVAQTKNESLPGGAKEITNCDDSSSEACMRGFDSPQIPGSPAGPDLGADYQINKN